MLLYYTEGEDSACVVYPSIKVLRAHVLARVDSADSYVREPGCALKEDKTGTGEF
jgi:hypothetical protein